MMLDYYEIDTIPLRDDRAPPILLSIVNKLSDFQMLTIYHKPSSSIQYDQEIPIPELVIFI